MTKISLVKLGLVICCLLFAGETWEDDRPAVAQVVALDECDPATFNAPTAVGRAFARMSLLELPPSSPTYLKRQLVELRTRTGTSNLTQ